MVTLVRAGRINEYYGKSESAGDTKPTVHVPNGSTYYEFDTKTLFVFDEDTAQWTEQ